MAGKKKQADAEVAADGCILAGEPVPAPTFILRADQPGNLRGLMAAIPELPEEAREDARQVLRAFELWEDVSREALLDGRGTCR